MNNTEQQITFKYLLNNYNVTIPIIQRDYAQGRKGKEEVRENFLQALYDYLAEGKKHRDLDFVYGNKAIEDSKRGNKFIPLDGQQRLTTLFLLHWYLANKEDAFSDFQNMICENGKSKFTYEVRTSSQEFCDELVKYSFQELSKKSLSESIKDQKWFFLSWETDPTIQSMLTMIDAIDEKFKNSQGFYKELMEDEVITFQFLDLGEFNLSDDLYIKMNARGIQLTPFENFKAKFEQYLGNDEFNALPKYHRNISIGETAEDVKTYFSHQIDTNWANFFWGFAKNNSVGYYDDYIMNFILVFATNHRAGKGNAEGSVKKMLNT